MFNMKDIGRKIFTLRKENDMTQVELADKIGVSYQAVSNWERGESMPDIAKLTDLSKIFNISIDQLLNNEKEINLVKDIIDNDSVNLKDLSSDDLKGVLPILKPKQIAKSFDGSTNLNFEQIMVIAPFMEEDELEEFINERLLEDINAKWIGLAPFVSKSFISKMFKQYIEKDELNSLTTLAPFMDEEELGKYILEIYNNKGEVGSLISLIPFVSSNIVRKIYEEEFKKGNTKSIAMLIPFI